MNAIESALSRVVLPRFQAPTDEERIASMGRIRADHPLPDHTAAANRRVVADRRVDADSVARSLARARTAELDRIVPTVLREERKLAEGVTNLIRERTPDHNPGAMTIVRRPDEFGLPASLMPPKGMTRWHTITLMANRIDSRGMTLADVRDVCDVLARTGRAVPESEWQSR